MPLSTTAVAITGALAVALGRVGAVACDATGTAVWEGCGDGGSSAVLALAVASGTARSGAEVVGTTAVSTSDVTGLEVVRPSGLDDDDE